MPRRVGGAVPHQRVEDRQAGADEVRHEGAGPVLRERLLPQEGRVVAAGREGWAFNLDKFNRWQFSLGVFR